MPYRKQQFVNGEIYHIVLRGIDGNVIFRNTDDYYRGIFSIYEFNNAKSVTIRERRKVRAKIKELSREDNRGRASVADDFSVDQRDKFIELFTFCFMPNHPHLLLRQVNDGGITKFMSKFGTGYGGYFNRKYHRKGYVFEDRFHAVHIKNEEQLKTVFVYIHANPISLVQPGWKEKGIEDPEKVIEFLENYKWSSYADYIGKKNFLSVTDRDFILKIMGGEKGCKEFVEYWVRYKGEIREFPEVCLD